MSLQEGGRTEPWEGPLHLYTGEGFFERRQEEGVEYLLLFEIGPRFRRHLWSVYSRCLAEQKCRGIVFVIESSSVIYSRLFFLRELALRLVASGREVGIWGVPECVLLEILDPWLYALLRERLIAPSGKGRCENGALKAAGSSLMLQCRGCIERERCFGLGSKRENLFPREFRSSVASRRAGRDRHFESDDPRMRELYRRFCDHVDGSDLHEADRYLYFIRTLDYGSRFATRDRFIYHCDYLPPWKYREEGEFLYTCSDQKALIERIVSLGEAGRISRLGLSRAFRNERERESFYCAPSFEDLSLLDAFGIERSWMPKKTELGGVGIDFYDAKPVDLKLYLLVQKEWLVRNKGDLVDKIGIDPRRLKQQIHYYVLRLDPKGKRLLSERIDLAFDPSDFSSYASLLQRFGVDDPQKEGIKIFGFAFDFEEESLKKITLYYRNAYL